MNVITGQKMRPNGTRLICVLYGLELDVIKGVIEHLCYFVCALNLLIRILG